MSAEDLKEMPADKVLNVVGKICPYPLRDTKKTLKEIKEGEVLEVINRPCACSV
jgi:TusA-related sulfurtransferase